jgi:TPR repeat protein
MEKAFEYYKIAAEKGHRVAQYNLGHVEEKLKKMKLIL